MMEMMDQMRAWGWIWAFVGLALLVLLILLIVHLSRRGPGGSR